MSPMLKVHIENDHSAKKSVNNNATSDEIPEHVISNKTSHDFIKSQLASQSSDIQDLKKNLNNLNNLLHNLKKEHPAESRAGQSPTKTSPTNNRVTENMEPEHIAGQFPTKKQTTSTHSSSTKEVFIPLHSANKFRLPRMRTLSYLDRPLR